MKANELELGDWVYVKKWGYPVQISNVDSIGCTCWGGFSFYIPEDLEPVPLTDKILKENGFETGSDRYLGKIYRFQKTLFFIRIGRDNKTLQTNMCGCEVVIQYVHQLQHLMRLCRVGKEIEL